jgi:helix-turn-helix protein
MDAQTAAKASATAVSQVASRFMLDGATYAKGAGMGFQGIDFYAAGRGGVLGDVDADVVAAAFTFFEPGYLRSQWELGRTVMSPADAARAWAACGADWAEEHIPDDLDAAALIPLLDEVVAAGRPACAAVFSGWRALDVPASPKAHVLHQMNALRELRQGLHGAAVVAAGLTPHEALSLATPAMVPVFGWSEPADTTGVQPRWDEAEAATNVAIAHAYEALDEPRRDELVDRMRALYAAAAA